MASCVAGVVSKCDSALRGSYLIDWSLSSQIFPNQRVSILDTVGIYICKWEKNWVQYIIALIHNSWVVGKGQLISKAIYGVLDSPKKRTKKIPAKV